MRHEMNFRYRNQSHHPQMGKAPAPGQVPGGWLKQPSIRSSESGHERESRLGQHTYARFACVASSPLLPDCSPIAC
eukprot:365127-Chlamydomonas_euryale.AAC.1